MKSTTIEIINNVSELGFRYTLTDNGTYNCEYLNFNPYRSGWGENARTDDFTRSNIVAHIKAYRRRWRNYPGAFEVIFGKEIK